MRTQLQQLCVDKKEQELEVCGTEISGQSGSSSRSEQTTGIATGDNAGFEVNHLDIHDNDAGSRVVSNKKKKCQQRVSDGGDTSGMGLPQVTMKVFEKIESKGKTTFNEVADELVAELSDPMNSVLSPEKQQYDEKNIRRRTYDVLNVLMAVDIISKDRKEIQWKGLPSPSPIEELKTERLEIRNRIESKASYLQELEEQFVGLKNLVQRNEQLYRSENPPSGGLSLPFVLVQTPPHATVELEVEISEDNQDMQLVHFDFNSAPFQLYDDNYVLKSMEFCDRPRSDIVMLTEEGEVSSLSGLNQLQVPPSVPGTLENNTMESNKRHRCGSSLTLSGITNVTSSSLHSQVSSKNVFRKPLHIGPGKYVLKRPRSPHRIDESSQMNFDKSNNKEIYVECNENGEEYDVPDNNSVSSENVFRKPLHIGPGKYVLKRPRSPHRRDETSLMNFDISNNKEIYVECNENGEEYDVPDNHSFFGYIPDNHSVQVVTSQYWDIGEPTCICEYCGAMMWSEERLRKLSKAKNPKFNMCCFQGRIVIPHYHPLPQPLNDLFHKHDKRSKYFLDNIRSFNSMFAFTSMGGKLNKSLNDGNATPTFLMNGENYHQIGSLLPHPGIQPKFAQLYIYDTENEISNRMSVVSMKDNSSSLKATIVDDIKKVLDNHNPYAQTYRMIRDKICENDVPTLKLRILGKRGRDGRRYNLPTTSEVAALIVGDFDAADFERDIILETQSGLLKRISAFEPAYLPLQYPMLFPRGEDGFRKDIQYNDDSNAPTIKRRTITLREWFAYRIQQRITEQSTLLFSRRLFHQFLVDAYSMIESSRLKWIRNHQKDLRVEMYKGLTEAILRGEITPSTAGKRIVLPSSFTGGARYMIQNYQDAMTICGWAGHPDLFITFTCNHKWPELCGFLSKYKLKPKDRPDLVCRLFKIKLDHLIKEIKEGEIFGKVKAVIYTIEFQKRGLPHAHILVFLHPGSRHVHPQDIDRIICAEIPDKHSDPKLFNIVSALMIHSPCGDQNKNSPCMHNGKCTKYFPKRFVDNTIIDADGYPVYRRRDNGVFIRKGEFLVDNRFVVPYNRHLLLKYNSHINVEWCNQSRSLKYLFKFVNKGHDRVTAGFYNNDSKYDDEIKLYYDCRYLSSYEAVWRIFTFDINYKKPSVERLTFHLPGEQPVVFDDVDPINEVVNKPFIHNTKFLAWMDANKKYEEAKNLTYNQFPLKFVWKDSERQWYPRKKGHKIGRLHFVPPGIGEIYYLRTLLNYVKGPRSFAEIRTVNNVHYPTFKEACYAMSLLDDDKEYIDAIMEASHWGTGSNLRELFANYLLSNQFSRPEFVWNETWEYLTDDILSTQRMLLQLQDLVLSPTELKIFALSEIEKLLQSNHKSLSDFPTMPQPDLSMITARENRLIYDELNYDRHSLVEEYTRLMSTMTSEQRRIYDKIMTRVTENKPGLFFLYGYGGTGKTYIWRAMSAALRSKGDIVLTVASSGIAALLIPGGSTAHSRFSIPIQVDENSTCNIKQGSPIAELIVKAKLIIWDEAPMAHKHCFEAVDRTFRDILRFCDSRNINLPFGGKVVVLGGDFRQILPVIPKGTRQEVVHATINSSYLWDFCEVMTLHTNMRLLTDSLDSDFQQRKEFSDWILGIGDGNVGEDNDVDISVQIPDDLLIKSAGDSLTSIVYSTYPSFLDNMNDLSFFQDRAILAPKNDIVDKINDYMLGLIPGDRKTYLSFDSAYSPNSDVDNPDNVHTTEFFNTINGFGLPNHIVKLKVGVPVMLLRNINHSSGLCNGTRLIITRMGKYVLEGKVISGSNLGHKVYIPRLSLTPADVRIPFKFQRKQFPLTLSFAMTINKSQGQSLKHVGLYLSCSVFSHGQLYVALSRVTSRKGLKILAIDDESQDTNMTANVVYKEIFQKLS
ncbi:unnamed protein product [Trifolium pratense]|uniref:Uncharacterized protein n=1 Tax=Trifolium pratense TaxID=57577 RepID=A0ACB0IJ31_TRIPR|nr:unnamed protein product [Trifolium pratense]